MRNATIHRQTRGSNVEHNPILGVRFEQQRNRWRVRVYKQGEVFYLKYFKAHERDLAIEDYNQAVRRRDQAPPKQALHPDDLTIETLLDNVQQQH